MAATSHPRTGSRSSWFNGGAGNACLEQDLPSGSCNYRDLSVGSRAPVCGCQRFYLNTTNYSADPAAERAWCFCGHHACFHNAFSRQQQQSGQEQGVGALRTSVLENQGDVWGVQNATEPVVQHAGADVSKAPTGLGILPASQSQSQSINTRVWQALNAFARNQEDGGVSDTTSKLPSTAAPSVVEEPHLSPDRVVQQHPRLQGYRSMGPPVNIPQASAIRPNEDYSATEVATPSIAGTPDFLAVASSANQARGSPEQLQPFHPGSHLRPVANVVPSNESEHGRRKDSEYARNASANAQNSLQDLHNLMRTYSQRLEALESISFSQVPYEDLSDRFDVFDSRILDLEQWRTEQETERPSPEVTHDSSSKRRRLLPDETASFASDASFDSNAAAHAEAAVLATLAANAETHPRIDALENRVADLESAALPSYARPWQVQVVLLPWSRELRGIWFSSHEATQHSLRSTTQTSDEWTSAQATTTISSKSTVTGAWTTQSIEAWANDAQEWLSPKACGPSGTVFQRLASRGLVRTIHLTTSDASHILREIKSAFVNPLAAIDGSVPAEHATKYQALSEAIIPLRKVRKSSRLRFLSPAEMTTSAIWTARFLDSSVFMKTNLDQRRLYVTTPEAYTQPIPAASPLNWKRIRDFPLCNEVTGDEVPRPESNVAIEACWTYRDNLDQPSSVHSSFVGSHASQWSTRSQFAPDADDGHEHAVSQPPMSPWSESRVPPHQHQRTVSLPTSASTSTRMQEAVPQRRIASFGPSAATATKHTYRVAAPEESDEADAEIVAAKRRRISLSPEIERRKGGVNFTPRWSREPPSPFTASETALENNNNNNNNNNTMATRSNNSGGGGGRDNRGTTPFAYATPHSHSHGHGNAHGHGLFSGAVDGDGDTEVDTTVDAGFFADGGSEHGEDEWEGVGDGENEVLRDREDGSEFSRDSAGESEDEDDEAGSPGTAGNLNEGMEL